MLSMAETIQRAQALQHDIGPSQPPPTQVQDSHEDGTAIEVNSAPTIGFHDLDATKVNQP